MAPLPPESTARLYVDYLTAASGGVAHTMQLRFAGSDPTATAAQTRLANCLTAMGNSNFRQGWRVTGCRVALAGQAFTTATPIIAALAAFVGGNTNAYPRRLEAREFVFVARASGSPRRLRLSLFGVGANVVDLDTFKTTLNGVGSGFNGFYRELVAASSPLITIDGAAPVWYPYVNMNYNSYWEGRLRVS